jgi:mycothiol synthase
MTTENAPVTATLSDGYTARPARAGDATEAEAILGLIRACDLAETGETDDWTVQDILDDWRGLGDVTSGTLLIYAPEGQLAGYGTIQSHGAGRLDEDVYVHPNHRGRGLGTFMTHELEARARRLLGEQPAGMRVVLGTGITRGNEEARRLLEAEGYHEARQFWRMTLDMRAPPPEPRWPDGITVRTCVPSQDERIIFDTLEEVFLDHWGHARRSFEEWEAQSVRSESYDPSLWWLALAGDEPAGAIRCRVRPDGGWVHTLGVRRAWRGRGLGKALLLQAFGVFFRRGIYRVALGVDAENPTGATQLYEGAGMRVAAHYTVYQKVLRAGTQAAAATAR